MREKLSSKNEPNRFLTELESLEVWSGPVVECRADRRLRRVHEEPQRRHHAVLHLVLVAPPRLDVDDGEVEVAGEERDGPDREQDGVAADQEALAPEADRELRRRRRRRVAVDLRGAPVLLDGRPRVQNRVDLGVVRKVRVHGVQ
jgi:hypothetical protein